MRIVIASLLVGVLGILLSRVGLRRVATGDRDPHAYWGLGLVALLPAWLIAFLTLLPGDPGLRPQPLPMALWILSAAAALLGAILTERRACPSDESKDIRSPAESWRLGVLAFVPAWAIVLVGHALA